MANAPHLQTAKNKEINKTTEEEEEETLISNNWLTIKHAHFFTAAEQELLLEEYAEFESLIKPPGNTSKCAKARREGLQKV